MGTRIDLTGKQFNRLTVIKEDPVRANDGRIKWICQCDCGNIKSISGSSLRRGLAQSCGCLQKERTKIANLGNKHGQNNAIDLTGQLKGQLLPIKRLDTKARNNSWEWLCQCTCGRTCISNTTDLNSGRKTRCNYCSDHAIISKGEQTIKTLLKNNDIYFVQQKTFENCIHPLTNKQLRFDFFIVDQNYLIEFDGEQHYKLSQTSKWYNKCKTLSLRDEYKNEWCLKNNIPLIRIPYTHLSQLTLNDLLLQTTSFLVV